MRDLMTFLPHEGLLAVYVEARPYMLLPLIGCNLISVSLGFTATYCLSQGLLLDPPGLLYSTGATRTVVLNWGKPMPRLIGEIFLNY